MTLDFRNRLPGIGVEHAGNYETSIVYQRADFESAALIHKSVSTLRGAAEPRTGEPGLLDWASSTSAVVSNWASLFEQLEFAGSSHLTHVPVLNAASMPRGNMDTAVLFESAPGKLACLVAPSRGGFSLDAAKQSGAVGELGQVGELAAVWESCAWESWAVGELVEAGAAVCRTNPP